MNYLPLRLTYLIFIKNIYAFLFKTGIIGSTIIFTIYLNKMLSKGLRKMLSLLRKA
jgi:hypothetical protein